MEIMNTLKTKPLCISSLNSANMLTMVRKWTLLDLEVRGKKSRSKLTYIKIIL